MNKSNYNKCAIESLKRFAHFILKIEITDDVFNCIFYDFEEWFDDWWLQFDDTEEVSEEDDQLWQHDLEKFADKSIQYYIYCIEEQLKKSECPAQFSYPTTN